MNRRYYDEEMRYLQEASKAFAAEHPEVARYLNVDSLTDRDPYVERLFEGFAFLTGRVREQLDDELPQYTDGLLQLLAPQFLKPLPACAIVALTPKPGLIQEPTRLGRGLEVRSAPVGDEYVTCRFQTTQDVLLQPLRLTKAEPRWGGGQASSLRLRFDVERGADAKKLDLSALRLYFHADPPTASALYLFCTRHVTRVGLGAADARPEAMQVLHGQRWVAPAALHPEASLLPEEPRIFSGYRLLQEFLCFPRKFGFVDLLGLDRLGLPDGAGSFDVELFFDRLYPEDRTFSAENVRLHCTPVVNLFDADAEPVRAAGYAAEHRLIPSVSQRRGVEVYDVQEVTGLEDVTGQRHTYLPFFEFKHQGGGRPDRSFTTSRRTGPAGHPEVYLALSTPPSPNGAAQRAETISIAIRASNGNLPHEKLQEGGINQLGPDVPQIVKPSNLTKPTRRLFPPADRQQGYFWKLISHWSLNFLSVADRDALTGLLDLYDWTDGDAARRQNQRRLEGIEAVRWEPKEIVRRGVILRGTEVTLSVRDDHFASEGDLGLFGLVLSTFFAMYATINSFVHLVIETVPTGTRYAWTPSRGIQPTL